MPEPTDNGPAEGDAEGPDQHFDPREQQDDAPSWKPPASQEELTKLIEKRLNQERRKYADYDAVKEKASQFDALAAASRTDLERAAEEAQAAGFSAAMEKTVPRLVKAEFRAAAKGRLDKAQLDALLEDLDLTKYVDDDGEPDVERIDKRVALLAPKNPPPNFGQGNRGTPPATRSMDDLIRERAGFAN